MTATQQIIVRAIQGGWEPKGVDFTGMDIDRRGILFFEDFPEDKREDIERDYVYFYDTEYPEEGYYFGMLIELAFLEASFWKSLGLNERTVTLNLSDMDSTSMGRPWHREKQSVSYIKKTPNRWRTEWHRFIDALADGKDIEEALKSIE